MPDKPPPDEIATFFNDQTGERLREGLAKFWPKIPMTVAHVLREGHHMKAIMVEADPVTLGEMRSFVRGFFSAQ